MGFQPPPGWLEPDGAAVLAFLDFLHPRGAVDAPRLLAQGGRHVMVSNNDTN